MNKTVSINLGGLFFHIDENAYQKLNNYFDAIRRSLSPDGKEEIMNDIESRIAELLTEKLKNDKQVVSIKEVDEIIAIMGEPEDYRIEEEAAEPKSTYTYSNYTYAKSRKFYRDGDRAIVAGVCAGIGHYFRIDPLWIRILFIISPFISFGTSIVVYVLLWILIPKAITTTEKLEMTGEPINISNIERKVKEEIDSITSKLNNIDYNKINASAMSGAEKLGNGLGNVFMALFKGIAKVIGALITIFAAITLGGLIIAFFTMLFSSTMVEMPWYHYANMGNYTEVPLWIIALLGLFAIGIPFFFLFLLGLKILSDNLKPIGSITKYTLLAIWLIAVAFSIYLGVRQANEISYEGKTMETKEIVLSKNDTLFVKFRYNDYFSKTVDHNTDFKIIQDQSQNDIIYSNNIELYFMKTDKAAPYLQIEKNAEGGSLSDARQRAEKIEYDFEMQGNNLTLNNYLVTGMQNTYRFQRVRIFVYLPEGYYVQADKSIRHYNRAGYSGLDIPFSDADHLYYLDSEGIKCLDCPDEPEAQEEDTAHIEFSTNGDTLINTDKDVDVDIKVNQDGLKFSATTKKANVN